MDVQESRSERWKILNKGASHSWSKLKDWPYQECGSRWLGRGYFAIVGVELVSALRAASEKSWLG